MSLRSFRIGPSDQAKHRRVKALPAINLIPFVDCLVVLVAYLLWNTSLTRLAHLTTSAGKPSTEQGPANLEPYLSVVFHDSGVLTFGGPSDNDVFPAISPRPKGRIDTEGFARFLGQLPRSFRHVVLIPTPQTSYQEVAKLTELSQKDLRSVVLSAPPAGKEEP